MPRKKKAIAKYPSTIQSLPGAFQGNKNSAWNAIETDSSPSPRIHRLENKDFSCAKTISSHRYTHTHADQEGLESIMFDMLEIWLICKSVEMFFFLLFELYNENQGPKMRKTVWLSIPKISLYPRQSHTLGMVENSYSKVLYSVRQEFLSRFRGQSCRWCEETKPHWNSICSYFSVLYVFTFLHKSLNRSLPLHHLNIFQTLFFLLSFSAPLSCVPKLNTCLISVISPFPLVHFPQ